MTTLFCLKFGPCFGGQTTPKIEDCYRFQVYIYIFISYQIISIYYRTSTSRKKSSNSSHPQSSVSPSRVSNGTPFCLSVKAPERPRGIGIPRIRPVEGWGGTGQVVGFRSWRCLENQLGTWNIPKRTWIWNLDLCFFFNGFLPICEWPFFGEDFFLKLTFQASNKQIQDKHL